MFIVTPHIEACDRNCFLVELLHPPKGLKLSKLVRLSGPDHHKGIEVDKSHAF
jgi:hypothetical protein